MRMIYSFEFKDESKNDIIEASAWYRKQQPGLEIRFLSAVEEAVQRIVNNPYAGQKIYKAYRQTAIKKFPYVLVYEIIDNSIINYILFHTSQHPKKKFRRLKK